MIDNQETRKRFAGAISGAFVAVGKEAPPAQVLMVFFEVLKGYEIDEIERAAMGHLADPDSGMFAPKPADIVKRIDGNANSRATVAWSKVSKAIGKVGQYDSVAFDDPLIHAVIEDMGGWVAICASSEDEIRFRAAEFERRYRGYTLTPPLRHVSHLPGIFETQNVISGFKPEPPMLIGDRQKALAVIRAGSTGETLQISDMRAAQKAEAIALGVVKQIAGRSP